MSLLVTGGLGFLGLQTAKQMLKRGVVWSPLFKQPIELKKLTLFDVPAALSSAASVPEEFRHDSRVRIVTGDLAEPGIAAELIDDDDLSVVHLASMVSGDTEAQPEKAWLVNVEGQRALLEAIRTTAPGARFLFTSSTATLGPVAEGESSDDTTKLLPGNTYGFHKAVCELMINDYARRGWVDSRGLRLPVIVVRPGAPNAALTGAWSTVVRDPLKGIDCTIPIPMDATLPVASYQTVVSSVEAMLNDVDGAKLGPDRTMMLPSLSTSPAELYAAAQGFADVHGLPIGKVTARPEEVATRIVGGMGSRADGQRAESVGLPRDESPEAIVAAYASDWVLPKLEP
mmetsp:Transcript_2279/g.6406  ORF Transcript_2279/g.6406 Transcript_2279/m.6406 type:complete len:343 (-) Transcript_2279:109-1137(-)